jgi:alkaline phosphatase D
VTDRFPLGVASFDPTNDGVLLWTSTSGAARLRWAVAADPDFGDVVATGEAEVEAEPWTVTVDVAGLAPGCTYWYRFETEGDLSPVGRTRTLPLDGAGADRLRVGLVCCARYSQSTFAVYRAVAASDVDVVVHLGDYVYEDAKGGVRGREPDPPHEAFSLEDYRRRHAQHRHDRDLQALHAAHPMVVIWDDHDFADNAARDGAPHHDERKHGPWRDRVLAAARAHQEFAPKRLADPDDLTSSWRSFDAGTLLRLVCSETRVHGRDTQAVVDETTLPVDDPERSLLGDAQREWLLAQLADPTPAWVLLASGTVVSELEIDAPDRLDHVLPEKYEVAGGRAFNTDQWDGYQAERARVAAAFAERDGGRGCLVVSGDIHSSWAIEGPLGPSTRPVAVELVCPPAATTPLGQLLPAGVGSRLGPALRHHLPNVRWVDVEHHGYLVLDVARDRTVATFWWVDPEGDGRPVRAAVWAVLPGQPGRLRAVGHVSELEDEAPPAPLDPVRRRRRLRFVRTVAVGGVVAVVGRALRGRSSGS